MRRGDSRGRSTPGGAACRRSAARVVVDREAERARGGVILKVVARTLEPRRRGEQADDGGLVGRKLALLGLIPPHELLHRRQGSLISGELGARERTVVLQLLDLRGRRGEVLHTPASGGRH